MTEHSKLVAKIKVVQKMAIGDRLKFARKQRNAQIKKWAQYDLELKKRKQKKPGKRIDESMGRRGTEYSVHFENSVTLMEAAARNDVEEGKFNWFGLERTVLVGGHGHDRTCQTRTAEETPRIARDPITARDPIITMKEHPPTMAS